MGIFDKLRQMFRSEKALSSDSKRFEAIQSETDIGIERDSLQLGIAAGFTGRALRGIEDSLKRIEAQMVTRDWLNLEFRQYLDSRLNALQTLFESLATEAGKLPEHLRGPLQKNVYQIRSELQLTSQMKRVLSILFDRKELSYEDLAKELGITVSALRGLLSLTVRRSGAIERFEKDGKGWVRLLDTELNYDSSDLNRSEYEVYSESLLADKFEQITKNLGYRVIRQSKQPPDFILEKDSKKIGAELKFSVGHPSLQKALGQLTFAKSQGLDELWLVIPPIRSTLPAEWLSTFRENGIRVFCISDQSLVEIFLIG